MLLIKTIKNPLVVDQDKDGYCFRSSTSQKISENQLVKEMTSYNSSFTEADMAGMLSVLNTVVTNKLTEGHTVELPFGDIFPSVTGTCSGIQSSFALGQGNHQLSFGFSAKKAIKEAIAQGLKYKQIAPDATNEPKIYRLSSLLDNAQESDILSLTSGKILRLHGRNLSFDFDDTAQGVFLENDDVKKRITRFTRAGSNIIDIPIPSDVAAGDYTVFVITKPDTSYYTASADDTVTVA